MEIISVILEPRKLSVIIVELSSTGSQGVVQQTK